MSTDHCLQKSQISKAYIYLIDIIEIEHIINHNIHYALKQQGYTEDIVNYIIN
jgi:hypothetical protein